jgi:hypothetical protein
MIDILFIKNGTAYSGNCFTCEKELNVSKLPYYMLMLNYAHYIIVFFFIGKYRIQEITIIHTCYGGKS